MHVTAIIAAGGRGLRFGGARPKQLLALDGRTLLERSVDAFLDASVDRRGGRRAPAGHRSGSAPLPAERGQAAARRRRRRTPAGFGVECVCRRSRGERSDPGSRRGTAVRLGRSDRPHDRRRRRARRRDCRDRGRATRSSGASVGGARGSRLQPDWITSCRKRWTARRSFSRRRRRAFAATCSRRRCARAVGGRRDRRSGPGRARRLCRCTSSPASRRTSRSRRRRTSTPRVDESRPARTGRAGLGYDLHRLVAGRPLILGGVTIPSERGALGHSDADVVCHAVTDAILGAAALGDIGRHFPDTDPRWKDAHSLDLLRQAVTMAADSGFEVGNVDVTVMLETPKLRGHIDAIRAVARDRARHRRRSGQRQGEDQRGRRRDRPRRSDRRAGDRAAEKPA